MASLNDFKNHQLYKSLDANIPNNNKNGDENNSFHSDQVNEIDKNDLKLNNFECQNIAISNPLSIPIITTTATTTSSTTTKMTNNTILEHEAFKNHVGSSNKFTEEKKSIKTIETPKRENKSSTDNNGMYFIRNRTTWINTKTHNFTINSNPHS